MLMKLSWDFFVVCNSLTLHHIQNVTFHSAYSWCLHPPSLTTYHNFTSGRGYPELRAAWLESTTRCHRIYSTLARWVRWNISLCLLSFISSYVPAGQSCHFNRSRFSDVGRSLSVTLPAASTSYQVTGLRLGRQYRFTVQPTFARGLGAESSVEEHTGNARTSTFIYLPHLQYIHLLIPYSCKLVFPQCVWAGVWMWCSWCRHLLIVSALRDLCGNSSPVWQSRSTPSEPATHRYCSWRSLNTGCRRVDFSHILPTFWLFSACFRWEL